MTKLKSFTARSRSQFLSFPRSAVGSNNLHFSLMLIRKILLSAVVLAMAGCGEIEWFPQYVRSPTTPDQFSFPTKTGVAVNTSVTSDPITVSGLTGDSSPIQISGAVGSNSKYSINNGTAVDTPGTVKNTDTVTVTHTSAAAPGITTTSTLRIGDISGTFSSVTQTITAPVFASATALPGQVITSAPVTITSVDGIAGTHVISIKDDRNSNNALYSLDTESFFTNVTQTMPNLNGRLIFLRNTASNTSGGVVTTTLTIDGVNSTFVITTR